MITGRERAERVPATSSRARRGRRAARRVRRAARRWSARLRALPRADSPTRRSSPTLRERLMAEAATVLARPPTSAAPPRPGSGCVAAAPTTRRVRHRRRRRGWPPPWPGSSWSAPRASLAVAAQPALPGDRALPAQARHRARPRPAHLRPGRTGPGAARQRHDPARRGAASSADERRERGRRSASTLDAFSREAVAGADLLVADYQATGDRSSMTHAAHVHRDQHGAGYAASQSVLPAGALDELLQAAQALDQIEQVAGHACSSCAGPLIGSIPPVLSRRCRPPSTPGRSALRPGPARTAGIACPRATSTLPQVGGDLPPASVTDPGQTGLEPTAGDVQHTLQHLTGGLDRRPSSPTSAPTGTADRRSTRARRPTVAGPPTTRRRRRCSRRCRRRRCRRLDRRTVACRRLLGELDGGLGDAVDPRSLDDLTGAPGAPTVRPVGQRKTDCALHQQRVERLLDGLAHLVGDVEDQHRVVGRARRRSSSVRIGSPNSISHFDGSGTSPSGPSQREERRDRDVGDAEQPGQRRDVADQRVDLLGADDRARHDRDAGAQRGGRRSRRGRSAGACSARRTACRCP